MGMIRTVVSGYGYWGRILVANLLRHPDYFVAGVCDPDGLMRADAEAHHNLYAWDSLDAAISEGNPELVIVASPISTIVDSALVAISKYRHVMMAKPGATTMRDAERLIAAAEEREVKIVTDYTMMMSPRVEELRADIERLGGAFLVQCERNSRSYRSPASILDDMMVHDLSILCALTDEEWVVRGSDITETTGRVILESDSASAVVEANRIAPAEKRRLVIHCWKGMLVWDQLDDDHSRDVVYRRLSDTALTIRTQRSDNRDTMLRIASLLEAAA